MRDLLCVRPPPRLPAFSAAPPLGSGAGIVVLGTAAILACSDSTIDPLPPSVPTAIAVSPADARFSALGDTVRLSAEVRDQHGWVMEGAAVTWASSAPGVAAVDAAGLVTAVGDGSAAVTATSGEASGSAQVTVAQEAASVAVSADTLSFAALGDTVRLSAEAHDRNGRVISGAAVTWASSAPGVAAVDAAGLVTAVGDGSAAVTATSGEASGSAQVTVAQEAASVAVSADTLSFAALGDTVRLSAEAHDRNGRVISGAAVTWASSAPGVAAVDAAGLVTAVGDGSAAVTATSGEASGSAQVTVAQEAASVAVSADTLSFAALGDTVRLSAEVRDHNGQVISGAAVTWASSDPGVAAVDSTGLVTAVGDGSAAVTATSGEASGSAQVTVAQEAISLVVSPASATLEPGDTVRLSAEVRDHNGQVISGAAVTWTSSDPAVAAVDAAGLVTAVGDGSAAVTATSGEASGSAQVTVAQEAASVVVSPASATLVPGDTIRLSAEAHDRNGRVIDAAVTWTTSDPAVAAVDAAGLVTAVGDGSAAVTATSGEASGSAQVTVAQEAASVVVSPASATLVPGDTIRLSAEAHDRNGRVIDAAVTWTTSDPAVAAVDATGLVTALAEGSATVAGALGRASGSANITVDSLPDRAALVALYESANGPGWTRSTNWLTDAPLGDWYGVGTNAAGRVVYLQLEENRLTGPIPPELGGLSSLSSLYLYGNQLTGAIPPELGGLSSLSSLYLGVNQLTGAIPPELGSLSSLSRLYLYGNQLTGAIPPELGGLSSLSRLSLGVNQLTGAIPPELGGLSSLSLLYLGGNQLTGPIPPELGGLSKLEGLYLYGNQLTGAIPPELGGLSSLSSLYLYGNQLTGAIPPELGGLSKLEGLYLYGNQLTGAIPPELGSLSSLSRLYLYGNQLTGAIPPELGSLSSLSRLSLGVNQLTGAIPPELGSLSSLSRLSLGVNQLTGPIPPELGGLSKLEGLSLYGNQLTGAIPPELGGLSSLSSLNLGGNQLTGPIPPELGNLSSLTSLGISGNQLTGTIPASLLRLERLGFVSFFCGPPRLGRICAPGTTDFVAWLEGTNYDGPFCNQKDVDALESLYNAAGGAEWAISDGWLGGAGLGDWSGVTADSLGNVVALDLNGNNLAGRLSASLGHLSEITELRIGGNPLLEDRLPLSLARLSLKVFHYAGTELCAPDDQSFREWLDGIPSLESTGAECTLTERDLLAALYTSMNGRNWIRSDNWLTDAPLREWHGVQTNAAGRVGALELRANNLEGLIPADLGSLSNLSSLDLGSNRLTGPIPSELGKLTSLERLDLGSNQLFDSIPSELGSLSSLSSLSLGSNQLTGAIPPELGSLSSLSRLYLYGNQLTGAIPPELGGLSSLSRLSLGSNQLTGAIPPELGGLSSLSRLSLYGNQLTGAIPPELGGLSSLSSLNLYGNQLTGAIPPELGGLSSLSSLYLYGNQLTGAIPPELGGLSSLSSLSLYGNQLTGAIPPELGGLSSLSSLYLGGNQLTGAIPPELGGLSSLSSLHLEDNQLTGPIPLELGKLTSLERLDLGGNQLTGFVPPEMGGLVRLVHFGLANNARLSGTLPASLTELGALDEFLTGGTGLCAPVGDAFNRWLADIAFHRVRRCVVRGGSAAYLTQAVQSLDFPVPLVASEPAMLRVFVAATGAAGTSMPAVRARFYLNGAETHAVAIPASSAPVPAEADESSLESSANAEIPGGVIRPGLEMVVEIDPDGTLDPGLGITKRIPGEGRAFVDVRAVPELDLTMIPFLYGASPDSSVLDITRGLTANDELFRDTRTLLPVRGIGLAIHEPVVMSSNHAYDLLRATAAIRAAEGGTGHYMGTMAGSVAGPAGVAYVRGRTSFSVPRSIVIAHELGHNLSLGHAPCNRPPGPDPNFPSPEGSISAWGYDFGRSRLVPPTTPDLMSYCHPQWISDYSFSKALAFRIADEAGGQPFADGPVAALLVWGGLDADGTPFLEPAFALDAPISVPPPGGGEYELAVRDAAGLTLFSVGFDMPEVADGDGRSSFAFVLPADPAWAGSLASITLTGPGGTAELNADTDRPAAILRDPATGRIRAILRDLPPGLTAQADTGAAALSPGDAAALSLEPGLEVLVSRGIPGSDAWR